MRLWIVTLSLIWGLIACTPRGITPPPPPAGSPVELKVDDTEISLVTTAGWQAYASNDRIVLGHDDEIAVNIWIPEIDLANYDSITNAAVDIVSIIEDEENLYVTQPVPVQWNGYDSVYFFISNGTPETSMIIVSQVAKETPVALHIRGIDANFTELKEQLATTFEYFSVNDSLLSGHVFAELPDTLNLPSRGAEAALDPSAEP